MNIPRKTRKRQARLHLEKGFSREETLLFLKEKKCPKRLAENILDELAPCPSQDLLCKRFFIGGLFLGAALINLIIFTTLGELHLGALSLGIFVPSMLALKLWGWPKEEALSQKDRLRVGKSMASSLGGFFNSY